MVGVPQRLQRQPHLGLPGQLMNNFIDVQGHLHARQLVTTFIDHLQIGDETHGVGHGHHTVAQVYPVPGHTCLCAPEFAAPHRLSHARCVTQTTACDLGSQVNKPAGEVLVGRWFGLPQYRRPSGNSPGKGHGGWVELGR